MSADNVPGIVWFLGALGNRQRRPLILEAFPFGGQKGKAVGGGDLRRSCDFTLHRLQKLPRTELGVSSWGSVLRELQNLIDSTVKRRPYTNKDVGDSQHSKHVTVCVNTGYLLFSF